MSQRMRDNPRGVVESGTLEEVVYGMGFPDTVGVRQSANRLFRLVSGSGSKGANSPPPISSWPH